MVVLEVFPERARQHRGKAAQGGVVDGRLTLAKVVHEKVPDGTAGEVVAVDQLLGGELSLEIRVEHPDGDRGPRREHAHLVQELVERRPFPSGAGEQGVADFHELQAVPDGDVGDRASLGGHDDGDPFHGGTGYRVTGQAGAAQLRQPREAGGITDARHLGGQVPRGRRGQQPPRAGPYDISADQLHHADAELPFGAGVVLRDPAGLAQPLRDLRPPVRVPVTAGTRGIPPVLPGPAGLGGKPVQDPDQPELAVALAGVVVQRERRGQQPAQHCRPVLAGEVPGSRGRARREAFPQGRALRAGQPGPGDLRSGMRARRRHHCCLPNRTSSASGR